VVDSLQEVSAEETVVDQTAGVSPTGAAMCDQEVIEDILREYATQFGAQIRWGEASTTAAGGPPPSSRARSARAA
jgi:hypothetical protein